MAVWIPNQTFTRYEALLRRLLKKNVSPEWDGSLGCWTVAHSHFIVLTDELLRRYPRIAVGREYNSDEVCNESCRRATGPICTCSCKARNHGRGKWMDRWALMAETDLVVMNREWSWIAVEKDRVEVKPGTEGS